MTSLANKKSCPAWAAYLQPVVFMSLARTRKTELPLSLCSSRLISLYFGEFEYGNGFLQEHFHFAISLINQFVLVYWIF
jgi:hypothetical protein